MDVKLYNTFDGATINLVNGLVEMDTGLGTAFYLSLFGGNNDGTEYWGNRIESDPNKRLKSETQKALAALPVTTGNLIKIQRAVESDLSWFDGVIYVSVGIPARGQANVVINTQTESFEYLLPWEPEL